MGGRLYAPVSFAHANASAALQVATDANALPAASTVSWSLVGWSPGTGIGGGIRVDGGVAWSVDPWTFGVGVGSIVDVFGGVGHDLLDRAESRRVTYEWSTPVPSAAVRYQAESPVGLTAGVQLAYSGTLVARAGGAITTGRFSWIAGVGWDRGTHGSAGVGVVLAGMRLETGVSVLPPVRLDEGTVHPWGVVVSIGRARERRR